MTWEAFPRTPFAVSRGGAMPSLGPWQLDRGYISDVIRPTNGEMTTMFEADQAARANPARIDWRVLSAADATRRVRTQALLDAGSLSSADDFYHAAFVLQHGTEPDDFLKAHALAIAAIARGRADAAWIAAATLDRYLQRIGRGQIYGTQFNRPAKIFTQEPYRSDLLRTTCVERLSFRLWMSRRDNERIGNNAYPKLADVEGIRVKAIWGY